MSGVQYPYRYQYETVAANQTGQVLGGVGRTGDYVERLICVVATAATSTVTLIDGATSIPFLPANTVAGTYSLPVEAASQSGAWSITTGAGVSVIAVGIFSA